jgi:cell division protein FtsZ
MSIEGISTNLSDSYLATIKIVGIGGGGCNAINHVASDGIDGAELIAMNTDAKHLLNIDADVKIDIGRELTGGLGAGGNPEIGEKAAEESEDEIRELLQGASMVIVTTGEGGGTGTGAAPVVARIAKELGCLTIAVVSRPFSYERNQKKALDGIEKLKDFVDSMIIIPNERLLEVMGKKAPMAQCLKFADKTLMDCVRAITDIITRTGVIDLDFNDLSAVLKDSGSAVIGIGEADGEDRLIKATEAAVYSPLLDTRIDGATGLILSVIASEETLTLSEFSDAATMLSESAAPDANIKDGLAYDETLGDRVRVIVIATGFDNSSETSSNSNSADNRGYGPKATSNYNVDNDTNKDANKDFDGETIRPLGDSLAHKERNSDNVEYTRPVSSYSFDGKSSINSNSSSDDSAASNKTEAFMPDFEQSFMKSTPDSASLFSSDSNVSIPGINNSSGSSKLPNSGSISSISNVSIPRADDFSHPSQSSFGSDGISSSHSTQEDSLELPDFLND